MNDAPSDFYQFLTHPNKFSHIAWTPVTAYSLISRDLVADYLGTIPTVLTKKFNNFFYFRAQLRVKIVVQGNPVAAGQIVYSFTPMPAAPFIGAQTSIVSEANLVNAKIVPHVVIDPSKSETYELDLPVCTPTGWYEATDFLGSRHGSYKMEAFPYNPLFSGTATAPSISVCVYISLINPEFKGMTLLGPFEDEKQVGGSISAIAKGVSNVAAYGASLLPSFSPELTLFSKATGTLSEVLAWFGFSKPPAIGNTHFVTNRTCDNYSQADGISTSIVLGGSQEQSLALSPAYGLGELEDMSFDHIVSKRGLVAQWSIASATAAETLVFSMLVNPMVTLFDGGACPTPMGGVALPFGFWVGDIDIEFEIVASVFHRCTVVVCWDPAIDNDTPSSLLQAIAILRNVTVDVSGNTSFTVTVPYQQPMPWLPNSSSFLQSTSLATSVTNNGAIHFYVLNPITSNGSTDPLAVNVYYSSKNIRFGAPSVDRLLSSTVKMITLGSDDFVPTVPISFGPSSDLSLAFAKCFADHVRTVKHLVSRMTLYWTGIQTTTTLNENASISLRNLLIPKNDTDTTILTTYFGWYSFAYLGYRGGFRYSFGWDGTLASIANDKVNVAHSVVNRNLASAAVSTLFHGQGFLGSGYAYTEPNLAVSSRADVVCPMMQPLDFVPLRCVYAAYADNVTAEIYPEANPQSLVSTVYAGAADDGVLTWFVGFPRLD